MLKYIFILILVAIDLATKSFADAFFKDQINIFGNLVYLKYMENPGIAFSTYVEPTILKLLTITLIGIIIAYYYNVMRKELVYRESLVDISYILILSGAIGNALERVFNGYVIDFIGIRYFAVFNIADIFITIGIFLYVYLILFNHKDEYKRGDNLT